LIYLLIYYVLDKLEFQDHIPNTSSNYEVTKINKLFERK